MKVQTKIIKDQKQTRTTIPAIFVKEAGVETGHVAEWQLKKGKLSAKVMSHEEFIKGVKDDSSLPAQTRKAMSDEHPSDLEAIKRRDAKLAKTESMSAGDALDEENKE